MFEDHADALAERTEQLFVVVHPAPHRFPHLGRDGAFVQDEIAQQREDIVRAQSLRVGHVGEELRDHAGDEVSAAPQLQTEPQRPVVEMQVPEGPQGRPGGVEVSAGGDRREHESS